jgi:glycosyltransferase involved in cell wall biosynthesis
MRIAEIIGRYPPVYGGQTPVEIEINRQLAKRGHLIYFLTPRYDKIHAEYEYYEGINVVRVSPPLKGPLSELIYILNAFTKIRKLKIAPDIIVDLIPFGNSMLITRFFSKFWNIPVIGKLSQAGTNEPLASGNGSFGFLRKQLYDTYSKIIAIAPILVENCKLAGIVEDRVKLISNCLNTDLFVPVVDNVRQELKQRLFPGVKGKIVTVVGSVSKRKRPHLAIEAWKILKTKYVESATLVFIGPVTSSGQPFDGQYVDQLNKKICQYGLEDSVIFTGFQKNVHEYFQVSDIALFVSEREGLGMVVLEAMSSETPVVTVNLEKITEYILTDEKEGFVTSDDPFEISDRILILLSNPEIGKSMGKFGRMKVLDKFSVNKITDEIENLYHNAIS